MRIQWRYSLIIRNTFCMMKSYQIWGCLNWINRVLEGVVAGLRIWLKLTRMQSRPAWKTGSKICIRRNNLDSFLVNDIAKKSSILEGFSCMTAHPDRMRSYFRTFFEYGFGSNLFRYTDPDPQPWTLCGQWKSFVRESLFCNLALIPLQSKEHLSLPGWSPARDGPDIKFSGYPATRYPSCCLISGRCRFFR